MRIVSLLPSATEIICSLGLRDVLVGVTHECDYPVSVQGLPIVTNTLIPHDATSKEIDILVRKQLDSTTALYSLRMEVLEKLKPDLIVTQALCDVCAVAAEEVCDAAANLPGNPDVINLEPMCLADLFATIQLVGEATGRKTIAKDVVTQLEERVEKIRLINLRNESMDRKLSEVVFLEWIDPPFGPGHWNPELIELAGGICCIGSMHEPAETLDWQQVINAQPDVIFIACCGFDLERTLMDIKILEDLPGWSDLPCVKNRKVFVTDGNAYFSRPGPRLVDSLEIIAHALHPDIHTLPQNIPAARQVI